LRENLLGRGSGRQHHHITACGSQAAQDIALGAVIHRDNAVFRRGLAAKAGGPGPFGFVPAIALPAGHILRQIHAFQPWPAGGFGAKGRDIKLPIHAMAQNAIWRAAIADARGQRAGINAGKPRHAVGNQPSVQMPRGTVIGRLRDILLHDQPARGGCEGFDIFLIGADIADMGEGEGNDLPGIGRIGQGFLIAGHARVEADLGHRLALGPEAAAPKDAAISQHQAGGGARGGGIGHGKGLRFQGVRRGAGHIGQGQASGGQDGGPMFCGNGLGLPPFANGFRADAAALGRGFRTAQKGDDIFDAAHEAALSGKKLPRAREKRGVGNFLPQI